MHRGTGNTTTALVSNTNTSKHQFFCLCALDCLFLTILYRYFLFYFGDTMAFFVVSTEEQRCPRAFFTSYYLPGVDMRPHNMIQSILFPNKMRNPMLQKVVQSDRTVFFWGNETFYNTIDSPRSPYFLPKSRLLYFAAIKISWFPPLFYPMGPRRPVPHRAPAGRHHRPSVFPGAGGVRGHQPDLLRLPPGPSSLDPSPTASSPSTQAAVSNIPPTLALVLIRISKCTPRLFHPPFLFIVP